MNCLPRTFLPISLNCYWVLLTLASIALVNTRTTNAQVTAKQALALKPLQERDVDYSVPDAGETEKCTIETPKSSDVSGWIVKDSAGRILRRFLDTNGDNDIDLWCYYKDGFEVYRDIDDDFDRKADQYRWYGSQGTRWGKDSDQDGVIDSWNRISAEEVSAEVTMALKTNDPARFQRLLLTEKELDEIGFGEERKKSIRKTLEDSRSSFAKLARENRSTFSDAEWIHFGGLRPGIIPKDTDGATKDIVIYENVAALLRSNSKDLQISLGTMVHANNCWRMIDTPEIIDQKSTTTLASWYRPGEVDALGSRTSNPGGSVYQELLASFEKLDKQLVTAGTSTAKTKIYDQLVDTISQLALTAPDENEAFNWSRQFADSITAAFQSGDYPLGLTRLREFVTTLKEEKKSKQAIALVQYRYINADFGAKLNDSNVEISEAQSEWLDALEEFTKDFPTDENTPDAMMQLAMADEFEGEKEDAEKWYQLVSSRFPKSQYSLKAKGAIRRLNSIGETMQLTGKTVSGSTFDVGKYRGKLVLVHYWADWCEICKKEFVDLEKLQNRYDDLVLIGVNCDNDRETAVKAIRSTRVAWTQLYSEGGFNDGLAAKMGIVSLPSMILVDKEGQIVSTTVSSSTLERELKSLLK